MLDSGLAKQVMVEASKAPAVTVVIPTFNGARRVPLVLAALATQAVSEGSFEIIVVDNASEDGTRTLIDQHPITAQLRKGGISCHVVEEPRLGCTYARIRGVNLAQSELICFLDDDNIPSPDYIACGIKDFSDNTVGLVVSRVRVVWETPPPPSLRRRHLFANNSFLGDKPVDFGATGTIAPTVTAGMWVRRKAFEKAVLSSDHNHLIAGRIGTALNGGEDIEIGVLIGKAGFRRVFDPELQIDHLVPTSRLNTSYVRRLIYGTIRSELTVRERYESGPYGARKRCVAIARWLGTIMMLPALPLMRSDWKREVAFIMADRWARVRGPIRPVVEPGRGNKR